MHHSPSPPHATLRHRGFTLIEVLMVVTILSLLMGLSLQFGSAWKAGTLAAQARQLAADFSQASLLAQKDNLPVEFRFYMMPDELNQGSETAPRAFQMVRLKGYDPVSQEPIYEHLTNIRHFEDDIMLHETGEYSSIMDLPESTPRPNDPVIRGTARSYRSFMFLPNGSTSLPRSEEAVFTLVKESELPNKTSLPPNYRSVVLQPITANSTVF